jgi:DNA-binding MarR family transcriptional regulator
LGRGFDHCSTFSLDRLDRLEGHTMTPLQALILLKLLQHGPMRDVEIWQKTSELDISPVTMACLALEAQGHIELPRGARPVSHEWQLTAKGRAYAEKLVGIENEVRNG